MKTSTFIAIVSIVCVVSTSAFARGFGRSSGHLGGTRTVTVLEGVEIVGSYKVTVDYACPLESVFEHVRNGIKISEDSAALAAASRKNLLLLKIPREVYLVRVKAKTVVSNGPDARIDASKRAARSLSWSAILEDPTVKSLGLVPAGPYELFSLVGQCQVGLPGMSSTEVIVPPMPVPLPSGESASASGLVDVGRFTARVWSDCVEIGASANSVSVEDARAEAPLRFDCERTLIVLVR